MTDLKNELEEGAETGNSSIVCAPHLQQVLQGPKGDEYLLKDPYDDMISWGQHE